MGLIFGSRLRDLRSDRNLTQMQLAKEVGVSVSAIKSYENGWREPNGKALVAFERFFGVSGDYLRGDTDKAIFMSKSEVLQEELDQLIALFLTFKTNFGSSPRDKQILTISILEASIDLLSKNILDAEDALTLTVDEVVGPLAAVFQLNADGRAELLKRAAELTELSRYKS